VLLLPAPSVLECVPGVRVLVFGVLSLPVHCARLAAAEILACLWRHVLRAHELWKRADCGTARRVELLDTLADVAFLDERRALGRRAC
jgi:hypothetical protein